MARILAAGDDLIAAIKDANWGVISHPTRHMYTAMDLWEDVTAKYKEIVECPLRPPKTGG